MDTVNINGPVQRIARWLASSGILVILATAGLVVIPVSCTCGATVSHGHSLFQLPRHYHGSETVRATSDPQPVSGALEELTGDRAMCAGSGSDSDEDPPLNVAASNAMESQDGATLQAPPSSSFGHVLTISAPTLITLADPACETLVLPPARRLIGNDPLPETPPPQPVVTI